MKDENVKPAGEMLEGLFVPINIRLRKSWLEYSSEMVGMAEGSILFESVEFVTRDDVIRVALAMGLENLYKGLRLENPE